MQPEGYDLNYRALIEHSSDAIIVHDLEGLILYANPAARSLMGDPSLEAAQQRSIFDHLPAEMSTGVHRDIQNVLAGRTLPALVAPVFLANGDGWRSRSGRIW